MGQEAISSVSPQTSFIRVFEVWTPDDSGDFLQLSSYLYGKLNSFQEISTQTRFAYGEGLPGKAWKDKQPVILKEFDASAFIRIEAAHEVGLTSGVAIPFFDDQDNIKAVLVFLCGEQGSAVGAIEVWHDDHLSGMAWVDGYYGEMERFEWLSKLIKFPLGVGLPGGVWKSQTPKVIGDLPNSTSFLRAANARDAGITTGIGIPFFSPSNEEDVEAVVTFLSANETPIARRFEVWETFEDSSDLFFVSGIDQEKDQIEPTDKSRRIKIGQGIIGMALQEGIPTVSEAESKTPGGSLLVIPIKRLDGSHTVVVFYQ